MWGVGFSRPFEELAFESGMLFMSVEDYSVLQVPGDTWSKGRLHVRFASLMNPASEINGHDMTSPSPLPPFLPRFFVFIDAWARLLLVVQRTAPCVRKLARSWRLCRITTNTHFSPLWHREPISSSITVRKTTNTSW